MAKVSPYSQKVITCRGRACTKCGRCRDWYWRPDGNKKSVIYTKRPDAPCTAPYSYGIYGYGPGCLGCCLCIVGCIPFGDCCAQKY